MLPKMTEAHRLHSLVGGLMSLEQVTGSLAMEADVYGDDCVYEQVRIFMVKYPRHQRP